MKKFIFTSVSMIFILTHVYSQDVITTWTGDNIKAKVVEVTTAEIKYKKFENLDGPLYFILKSAVIMIKYENGTVDVFNEEKKAKENASMALSAQDNFMKGQMDASIHYKAYNRAGTGTLLASLLSPLVGLIPAIACSSTKPNEKNLQYPNQELMKNPDYYLGYTQKAKKIKQGKVWLNWGIGFGVNVVAEAILLSSHSH